MVKWIILLSFIGFFILGIVILTQNKKESKEKDLSIFIEERVKRGESGFLEDLFKPEGLNVDKIFSGDHLWIATLSAGRKRTLIVTGDIILGRMVNFRMVQKNDFTLPFQKTADLLKTGDLTLANFESPLVSNCKPTGEGMIFCGDTRGVEGLKFAGIDVVSLANNHIGNFGIEGIDQTVDILKDNGIEFTGVISDLTNLSSLSNLVVKEVKPPSFTLGGLRRAEGGLKFGFLGYNTIGGKEKGVSFADPETITEEIRLARQKVDILTVMFHWGEEYTLIPSEKQKELAHLVIDLGADLVLGNHPHWVQGVEIYKNKLIAYSHGNFIFDQAWSRETMEGVVGKYTFYDKDLIDLQFYPVLIEDYNQPRFLEGEEERVVLKRMKDGSKFLIFN